MNITSSSSSSYPPIDLAKRIANISQQKNAIFEQKTAGYKILRVLTLGIYNPLKAEKKALRSEIKTTKIEVKEEIERVRGHFAALKTKKPSLVESHLAIQDASLIKEVYVSMKALGIKSKTIESELKVLDTDIKEQSEVVKKGAEKLEGKFNSNMSDVKSAEDTQEMINGILEAEKNLENLKKISSVPEEFESELSEVKKNLISKLTEESESKISALKAGLQDVPEDTLTPEIREMVTQNNSLKETVDYLKQLGITAGDLVKNADAINVQVKPYTNLVKIDLQVNEVLKTEANFLNKIDTMIEMYTALSEKVDDPEIQDLLKALGEVKERVTGFNTELQTLQDEKNPIIKESKLVALYRSDSFKDYSKAVATLTPFVEAKVHERYKSVFMQQFAKQSFNGEPAAKAWSDSNIINFIQRLPRHADLAGLAELRHPGIKEYVKGITMEAQS